MRVTAGGVCLRDISVPGIGCHALLEVDVMATAFKHLSAILCVWGGGGCTGNLSKHFNYFNYIVHAQLGVAIYEPSDLNISAV